MPDYGFNFNLGPQAKQSSLADMLNIAGSAQNLQQNMQLNPLQVQQAEQALRQQQLATQKAEALTPQEITTGGIKLQEEAKQAPLATKEKTFDYKKKQGALATQILTGALRDPSIINAAQNPQGASQVLEHLNQLMISQGVDPEAAKEHMDPLRNVLRDHPEKLAGVLNYINSMYDINNIGWTYGIDDWGNEVDYAMSFYTGDFDEDEGLFKWYGEDYWTSDDSEGWGEEYRKDLLSKSPLLAFDDERDYDNLQGLFGNRWQPIFIEWFEYNFKVPVKKIIR
jgi:hypothetical protein